MRQRLAPVAMAAALAVAACGGGGSIQDAGNTSAGPTTGPADDTMATTTTTPLAELPPCPVDALDDVTSPVEVTFWHGMTSNLEAALIALTDRYNASQSKVKIILQNQGGYEQAFDKYLQSSHEDRPDMLQAPEYTLQQLRDTDSFIPAGACVEASGYDTSSLLPAALNAYSTEGVLWSMPFNVSNPVLYYNRQDFIDAGLDPDQPPKTLEELREVSQAIVDSGAAAYGIALDTSFDSGGGWFIEQWFAKAGEFYADNRNGRAAPATRVLFDGPTGVGFYTYLQDLVQDGLAVNVGDNPSGQDQFLKVADPREPAAMAIGTSAALGSVLAAVEGGLAPGIGVEDVGVGQMPGPSGSPVVLVGGASLWIVAGKGDQKAAGAWDFIQFLLSPEAQSEWADATGYVPVNVAALDVEPLASTYRTDPRFRVAYDALAATPPDEPTAVGPLIGPMRDVRVLTSRALAEVLQGGDPKQALARAAQQANSLIAQYAARR